jgi:hypothetical protein
MNFFEAPEEQCVLTDRKGAFVFSDENRRSVDAAFREGV